MWSVKEGKTRAIIHQAVTERARGYRYTISYNYFEIITYIEKRVLVRRRVGKILTHLNLILFKQCY